MELVDVINKRRAYRALEKVSIPDDIIKELSQISSLAPSCYNNQPWKYVFIKNESKLSKLYEAYSKGNEWCQKASMVIVVISKKEDDCVIDQRVYYNFDTGMSIAYLILKATDLGLVAHPIAGFNPKKVAEIINLPEGYEIITLIIVGKKSKELSSLTKSWQIEAEENRPERKRLEQFCFIDEFKDIN